jgi:hypothetical protein
MMSERQKAANQANAPPLHGTKDAGGESRRPFRRVPARPIRLINASSDERVTMVLLQVTVKRSISEAEAVSHGLKPPGKMDTPISNLSSTDPLHR